MDATTLAGINLNAVLRTLEQLPALDPTTAQLLASGRETIQFSAPGVATVRLVLGDGTISHHVGAGPCTIRLLFPRPVMVNKMFAAAGNPVPTKGLRRIKYLTGPFTAITDRLAYFLKPDQNLLDDPAYRLAPGAAEGR